MKVAIVMGSKSDMPVMQDAIDILKGFDIEIEVDICKGSKNFTAYTMDLTKKYIEINADYRS